MELLLVYMLFIKSWLFVFLLNHNRYSSQQADNIFNRNDKQILSILLTSINLIFQMVYN